MIVRISTEAEIECLSTARYETARSTKKGELTPLPFGNPIAKAPAASRGILVDNLERIGDYIARDNPNRAISFVQELRTKCLDLVQWPLIFPLVPRYERHGIRRRVYGDYLIFCRVQSDQVVIVHVIHGAMDYIPILFPV